jgi:hypothetical protein
VSSAVAGADAVNLDTLLAFPAVGGGLTVQGGHVYVDFGNMPTDKFEQMLKSIRVPIWLAATKNVYVRTDGDDANDGSANDAMHGFKTIQAAINYVTSNYNLQTYNVYIMVGPGHFGAFQCVKYQASSGIIVIIGSGKDVTFIERTNGSLVLLLTSAGEYSIQESTMQWTITEDSPGASIFYANSGSSLSLYNIKCVANELGVTSAGSTLAAIRASGGKIRNSSGCEMQCNGLTSGSRLLALMQDGGVYNFDYDMAVSGRCSVFERASNGGVFNVPATPPVFVGTMTGKRYEITGNAVVTTKSGANFFPGDVAGTTSSGGQYL